MLALAAAVLVLAALAVAALAVAALSSPRGNPRGSGKSALGVGGSRRAGVSGARSSLPGARHAPTSLQRREDRAIDATLRYTPVVTSGSGRRREVALTFDDGPSQYTTPILRILDREHVPATFFVVGQQLNRFKPRLSDELRHRFPIGDHTESHAWLARLDARGQAREIGDAAQRIRAAGGGLPRLFRPPYGAFNATTRAVLHRMHMLLVLWSVDSQDWRRRGVRSIVSNVLRTARPGRIVLMHDGGGYRDQTVAALKSIIDGLRRRHFELVSVPRLILDDPPPRHARLPRLQGA